MSTVYYNVGKILIKMLLLCFQLLADGNVLDIYKNRIPEIVTTINLANSALHTCTCIYRSKLAYQIIALDWLKYNELWF